MKRNHRGAFSTAGSSSPSLSPLIVVALIATTLLLMFMMTVVDEVEAGPRRPATRHRKGSRSGGGNSVRRYGGSEHKRNHRSRGVVKRKRNRTGTKRSRRHRGQRGMTKQQKRLIFGAGISALALTGLSAMDAIRSRKKVKETQGNLIQMVAFTYNVGQATSLAYLKESLRNRAVLKGV